MGNDSCVYWAYATALVLVLVFYAVRVSDVSGRRLAADAFTAFFGSPSAANHSETPDKTAPTALTVQDAVHIWGIGNWVYQADRARLHDHNNICHDTNCPDRADAWKWRWEPTDNVTAPYVEIDPEHFCRLLAGRHVLIVGDSLNHQLHDALLLVAQRTSTELMDNRREICDQWSCVSHAICTRFPDRYPPSRLKFVRNDYLRLNSDVIVNRTHNYLLYPWVDDLHDYPFLILNRGAHFVADAEFKAELRHTLTYIATHFANHTVVYRSTVPGHRDCKLHTQPLAVTLGGMNWTGSPYHWDEFVAQNEIARLEVAAVRAHYMDVYASTQWRPDSHVDCLHYCQPGVPDQWAVLLYNMMRLMKTST